MLLQYYVLKYRSHYIEKKRGKRLLTDLFLLILATILPIVMICWHNDNKQKQLSLLPMEKQHYVDGWQIIKTKGQVFNAKEENNSSEAIISQAWNISCGRLLEVTAKKLSHNELLKIKQSIWETINDRQVDARLLCENRARAENTEVKVIAKNFLYNDKNNEYKISTKKPLVIRIGEVNINSTNGGEVKYNGDIQLLQNINFNAPSIKIQAQGRVNLKNIGKENRQKLILKEKISLSYKHNTNFYDGHAESAEVLLCPKKTPNTNSHCNVMDTKSLHRITLTDAVKLRQYNLKQINTKAASPIWMISAHRVIIQGKQIRYQGNSNQAAHIAFADGTEAVGVQGGHNIYDNSGILCGAVQVNLAGTKLKSPCIRYNTTKQQYSLEPKIAEKELSQHFFTPNKWY